MPILALEVAAGKAAALLESKKGGGNNADASFEDFKAKEGKKASGSVKKKEKLGEEKKIKINDKGWQESAASKYGRKITQWKLFKIGPAAFF